MLPFLFTTLKRRLGTEDTKWWSVSGVILSHSSCKQVLRWATVRGLRCRILHFKMRHTFSIGDRSGLQAGQSSTRTLFLRSQDFVMCAECGFALSCWNMHGRIWKRCLLEGSILCSKISMYFSALMVPSQKCKLPLPRALTQPHTMTDPGFGLVAGNSLDDPFLLWSGAHGVHSSQKIPEILIHLTTVHVSTVWWSNTPDSTHQHVSRDCKTWIRCVR